MVRVPKKNVKPILVDVKKPDFNYEKSRSFSDLNLRRIPGKYKKRKRVPWSKLLKWGVGFTLFIFVVFGTFTVIGLRGTKVTLEAKGESALAGLFRSLELIKNFEAEEARSSLVESKKKLDEINRTINNSPKNFILSAGFKFVPFLKDVGNFLKQIAQLNVDLLHFSSVLYDIQHNGFSYFRNDGEKLLGLMKESRELVGEMKSEVGSLRNKAKGLEKLAHFGRMKNLLEEKYFVYGNQLYSLEGFLDGLIDLFGSKEAHILLMFQNSSELRPAGGFLGSYGDLVIGNGQMEKLVVEDIYWPDHPMNFDEKYIPPEPLQRVTKDWGARDANWFFDFPTSAEVVSTMLEKSEIYKRENIKFRGVVGVNVDVLGTVMKYVGPVELPEYKMTITAENFLPELQREVEAGKDKQAGENPKKILAVLAPKIIERLDDLPESKMKEMIEDLSKHIEMKDIMFYSRDERLNSFFKKNGVAGEMYELPGGFWGSYLAVVNSNIAGGKSDAFMDQKIGLWLNVGAKGGVVGDLKIFREHIGEGKLDPWYLATNKDYIKIYTNKNSSLIFAKGGDKRYEAKEEYDSSYKKLDVLRQIEETKTYDENYNVWVTEEFGKSAFATWLLTPAGAESNLEMRYENPSSENFKLEEGKKFRFIFDKQSGSDTALNVKVSAPLGYIWEESNSSVYSYETENVKRREIIELTLKNQFDEEVIKE